MIDVDCTAGLDLPADDLAQASCRVAVSGFNIDDALMILRGTPREKKAINYWVYYSNYDSNVWVSLALTSPNQAPPFSLVPSWTDARDHLDPARIRFP